LYLVTRSGFSPVSKPTMMGTLGHADASVTARICTHSQDDALRAAAKSLGEVVSSRVIDAG
jgi:hypothetical protein